MKKILLFLLLSISLCVFSQEKSIDVGVKTGAGLSFMVGKKKAFVSKHKVSYGLTNGFSFAYNSSKNFYLQTELLIERKTVRDEFYKTDFFGNPTEIVKRISGGDAVEIFILPGFKSKGKTKFLFNGGVFLGFFFNDHVTILPSDTQPQKEIFNKRTKGIAFDFGLSASIGLQHPITEHFIFTLENRFNVGIENFMRKIPFDFANNNIMFGFAYRFPLKSKESK